MAQDCFFGLKKNEVVFVKYEAIWARFSMAKGEVYMSDQIPVKEKVEGPLPSMQLAEAVERVEVSRDEGKRMLRGMLLKVLCCGAPFLLVLAIPLFGISLSGFLWSLLTLVVAMLACPLGTYLMMRKMYRK